MRAPWERILLAVGVAAGLAAGTAAGQGKEAEAVVARWLAANREVDTLRVHFTQTRRLSSLKVPLRESGVLWLDRAGKRFRWQTGDPPETIVTRQGEHLLIVRPNEKKYERRAGGEASLGGAAALAGGFPGDLAEFRRRYRLLEVKEERDSHRIVVQPLDRASRGLSAFTFVVATGTSRLQGIGIAFRDGSSQQIDFTELSLRDAFAEELFNPDLAGYQPAKFR